MQHLMPHALDAQLRSRLLECALALALLFASVLHADAQREECSVCGMWIDLYMKTRHVITLEDGSSESFCSIACASKYIKGHEGNISRVMAADFNTRELVNAEEAFYLSGSDVPGVMTYTSRIAFSTQKAADAFQKKHGGSIITFDQALRELEE